MKTCPVCQSKVFDDMEVCYGCMHRFSMGPSPSLQGGLRGGAGQADDAIRGAGLNAPSGEAVSRMLAGLDFQDDFEGMPLEEPCDVPCENAGEALPVGGLVESPSATSDIAVSLPPSGEAVRLSREESHCACRDLIPGEATELRVGGGYRLVITLEPIGACDGSSAPVGHDDHGRTPSSRG